MIKLLRDVPAFSRFNSRTVVLLLLFLPRPLLQYTAPERFQIDEEVDLLPCDVYSYAMVVYHIFTGVQPFEMEGCGHAVCGGGFE